MFLGGCGYPLKVEPFFDGTLEGRVFSEPRFPGESVLADGLVTLELSASNVSENRYDIAGSALLQGKTYQVIGVEEAGYELEYLRPQSFLIAGRVDLRLHEAGAPVYFLCGEVRYGTGGGLGPDREVPTAKLILYLQEESYCPVGTYIEENIPPGYLEFSP